MMSNGKPGVAVWIALGLLVLFAGLFVVVFVVASAAPPTETAVDESGFEARAAALLEQGDAARGSELVVTHLCENCHVLAAGFSAPGWNNLAVRAETRKPPLSAAAYLYESITEPTAYLVEGYGASMPQNFADVLTDQELGDILAYLLTLHPES